MKTKNWFLLWFFMFPFCIYAQNTKQLDSLYKVYFNSRDDTLKIKALADIAYAYRGSKPDTCIILAQKALALSEKINFGYGLEKSYNALAVGYHVKLNFPKALEYYLKALKINADLANRAVIFHNIGLIYREQGENEQALDYYLKALKISEDNKNIKENPQTINNIGVIYANTGVFDKAIYYHQRAMTLREKLNDRKGIAQSLNNIADLYVKQKKFDEAFAYYQKALPIQEQIGDKRGRIYTSSGMAHVYRQRKNYDTAITLCNKAMVLAEELKLPLEMNMLRDELFQNYKEKGDYEMALMYLMQFKQSQDSIFSVSKSTAIADLESRAALERKEQEIKLANLENEKKLAISARYASEKERELLIASKQAEADRLLRMAGEEKNKRKADSLRAMAQQAQLEANILKTESAKQTAEALREKESKQLLQYITYLVGAIVIFLAVLLYVIFRSREKEKKAKELVSSQNQELQASETELLKNVEELQTAQTTLAQQKDSLEKTLWELQETQTQLIYSEKMATLGQLVASIAHEINTPLGAIRSSSTHIAKSVEVLMQKLPLFLQTLKASEINTFHKLTTLVSNQNELLSTREQRALKYELEDELQTSVLANKDQIIDLIMNLGLNKHLAELKPVFEQDNALEFLENINYMNQLAKANNTVSLAATKASKIVVALKNFSYQNNSGIKQLINLNLSIETTLLLYGSQLKQQVEVVRHFSEVPEFEGYPDELVQVWTNLIQNAIQAMNGKGILTISTSYSNKHVLVSVQDTGSGIPEEVQGKIFEPFFTTKKVGEGSGLGLGIIQKIVQKHNGKIWFQTQKDKGTTFFVEIPI